MKLILKTELKPSVIEMEMVKIKQRPVVWFTKCETYEKTAMKGVTPFFDCAKDFAEFCRFYTAVRITVPESLAPLTWKDFLKTSGIRADKLGRRYARLQEEVALLLGSYVNEFRGSCDLIQCDQFSAVEVWASDR